MLAESEKIKILSREIKSISRKKIKLMEVCGTHTMSIARHGIRSLLPQEIGIISGPGCPVCVTSAADIHLAIELAQMQGVIVTTFGDMLKVPSNGDILLNYRNVRMIYNPLESLKIAEENPQKEVVFLAIGFETTAPLIAATVKTAENKATKNFSILSVHKLVPPALQVIAQSPDNKIQGLILPGHVSAVTGRKYFDFIRTVGMCGVVSGFDALGVLESIYLLARYINEERVEVSNNYQQVASEEGNQRAMQTLLEVFEVCDCWWRGIGEIANSGLALKERYHQFDAQKKFNLKKKEIKDPAGCLCGGILMGKFTPHQCKHFSTSCTPASPIGPCMVSSEGTCAAYFKYGVGDVNCR